MQIIRENGSAPPSGISDCPRGKMSSIRSVFVRAFASACEEVEVEENTVLREAVWAAMNADTSAPVTPKRVREETAVPNAPKRPARDPVAEITVAVAKMDLTSDAGSDDGKLTPMQKLEKQLATTQSKLETIRARQGTKKQTAKQKEKDPEEMEKLAAKIPEIEAKIAKLQEKEAAAEAKAAAKKPKAAPKAKAKEDEPKENFSKWTAPLKKHLTTAATARGKEADDALQFAVKHYLNGLTAEAYKAKNFGEHLADFFTPIPPAAPAEAEVEAVVAEIDEILAEPPKVERALPEPESDEENYEVEYAGKQYLVGERSMAVFEATAEGDVRVHDEGVINGVLETLGRA